MAERRRRRRRNDDDRRRRSGRGGAAAVRERAENRARGFAPKYLKVPRDVELFKVKEAKPKRLEIIPYIMQRDDHELCDKGELFDSVTLWVHRDVGPNKDAVLCPNKMFGKRCPICEHREKLREEEADEDDIKALYPKQRQLFQVYDHADADKGVQLWDVSYHLFGKSLEEYLLDSDEEDDHYSYLLPDEDGWTLKVGFGKRSFGGNPFFETRSIEMRKRKQETVETVARLFEEESHDLDSLIVPTSPKEVNKLFWAQDEEEETEEKPKKRRRRRDSEDDEETKQRRRRRRRRSRRTEDDGFTPDDDEVPF